MKDYIDKNTIKEETSEGYKDYSLCTKNRIFAKYGIGLYLFLNFLLSTAIMFTIMSLIAIPAMISNGNGNGVIYNIK